VDLVDRIGVGIKLRDLHIFLAVAEWKSMAKAARHLAVSQPVVSRATAIWRENEIYRSRSRMLT
jgi:Bacterial regulatory helix-turn-helix protein, lysR family